MIYSPFRNILNIFLLSELNEIKTHLVKYGNLKQIHTWQLKYFAIQHEKNRISVNNNL